MKVNVKYFGMIAEATGRGEEVIEISEGIRARDLKSLQVHQYGIQDPDSIQLAVNQELNKEVELKDGDEVAFLPPFAGG